MKDVSMPGMTGEELRPGSRVRPGMTGEMESEHWRELKARLKK